MTGRSVYIREQLSYILNVILDCINFFYNSSLQSCPMFLNNRNLARYLGELCFKPPFSIPHLSMCLLPLDPRRLIFLLCLLPLVLAISYGFFAVLPFHLMSEMLFLEALELNLLGLNLLRKLNMK